MRIADVTATLWTWDDIPPTRYTTTIASSGSRSTQMALLRIVADDGSDGFVSPWVPPRTSAALIGRFKRC